MPSMCHNTLTSRLALPNADPRTEVTFINISMFGKMGICQPNGKCEDGYGSTSVKIRDKTVIAIKVPRNRPK